MVDLITNVLSLFGWVADFFEAVILIVSDTVEAIEELIARINAIDFNIAFSPVLQFLAVVRYLIGDVNYLLVVGTFYISAGFLLYRLLNKLIVLIQYVFDRSGFNNVFVKLPQGKIPKIKP